MSTLLGYLSQFTDSKQPRVHNYGPNVQSTQTFKAVAKQAKALRNQYAAVAGSRLALTLTASADALVHMVALDGFVAELILLPVDHAVPKGCHFHISERGQLRELNDYSSDNLPVVTQWGLLDDEGDVISYSLDELANNELVKSGTGTDPLRWGVLQEPAELAGLLVWLRALKHGEDVVLAQADTLHALADMFIEAEVTAVAAPPRLWRNLTASEDITRLGLRFALVNGGIVDAATLQRLANLFPDAALTHSFSNTGAGVSWLIDDGKAGLPLSLFVANDDGLKLEINDGRLDIEFTGSGATIHTGYLAVKQDQRVFLLGHESNQLTVAGRGVQPEVVEQTLLQVTGVADVQASSMPNPVLGELVRVDVLAPSQRTVAERKAFKRALQDHCRDSLEPWQRPARYYFH